MIANVILFDLDLLFQGQASNVDISKTVRAGEKLLIMTLVDVDIYHRIRPLQIVLHNLDLHFQGQIFSCYAFAINCVGSEFPRQIFLHSHGPSPWSFSCY